MFKSTKLSDDKLATLEANLTHAQAFLDQAIASHRHARIDLGIAVSELEEAETPANLQAHQAALAASRTTSQAKVDAAKALATAQLALELAHTGPARAETANTIRKGTDRVEKAMAKLADLLTEMVAALDAVTHPEVFLNAPGPGRFHNWMLSALMALRGSDGAEFVKELRTYADQIVAGGRPYALRPTVAEEQIAVGLRKSA